MYDCLPKKKKKNCIIIKVLMQKKKKSTLSNKYKLLKQLYAVKQITKIRRFYV